MKLKTRTQEELAQMLRFQDFVVGNERGFNERQDVVTQTTDGTDLNRMWDEFQRVINVWNRDRSALVNALTYRVTDPVEGIRYPTGEDFEEATEFGEPKGLRLGPVYKLGFDFKWWDLAIRYTWLFLLESSSAQLSALNNSALEADNRLMFTKVLKAVFNNANRTTDINNEAVNVYPFYNGDGMVPPRYKNTTFTGSENHYLVSGAATVDSGDLDAIEAKLIGKGYGPTQGYKLVVLVNSEQGATIRGFKVASGAKYDFIPSNGYGGGVILPQGQIIGRPSGGIAGLNDIGTYGPFIIVEDDYIPAKYMLAFATGGENQFGNPIGIREHDNAAARGLQLVKGKDNDYPLVDSFYRHGFGTGVRHRGAGVVMQIKASGTYDVPAAYA